MNDPFSVISRALPPSTRVFGFRGTEAISTLYRFELYLHIDDPAFDMAGVVGADATFAIHREEGPILFHGIFAGIRTVDDLHHDFLYCAVLVPRLYKLTLTQHSLVFVNQSMPAILEAVLVGSGLEKEKDFTQRLSARYAPFEHVCQYRESNFAFLSRRMEREGVYYFFEQGEERERLVITDDLSFHRPFRSKPVRWVQVTGGAAVGSYGLRSFVCEHRSIPGSVRVQDYDYLKPALELSGEAEASGWAEQIHLHAENAVTPEDSRRLARIRAEELLARRVVLQGIGRGPVFLRTGYTFTVEDHPRLDGSYLATEIQHRGRHEGLGLPRKTAEIMGLRADEHADDINYHFDVVAIQARVQFRPERRTPVPRIYGLEKAVVDGEADHHYAQLDEHGRYLVKILFDESPLDNGKASTRIRMMQPHAGNPESFHFPLRKGTEVFLSFDGGDPDRPFIAGVAPNTFKPTRVTSGNYTRNVLETGGTNRILIEDLEDYQFVRISSPIHSSFIHLGAPNDSHNRISFTGGNGLSATGLDSETSVGQSRLTVIGDFFYRQYLDATKYSANISQGAFVTKQDFNVTNVPQFDHDPGNDPDPLMAEARGISPAQFDNPVVTSATAQVTEGDLTLEPPAMFRDPDGRSAYRVGSDLKYVRGDNVTKTEGDDLGVTLGDSKRHIHHASITHIDGGALTVVTPTTTSIDILKTSLYVSQFSIGMTNVSVAAFTTTQSALTLKNHGTEITNVLMKIIS